MSSHKSESSEAARPQDANSTRVSNASQDENRAGGHVSEPLMDAARMQWQFGEWRSLVELGEDDIRDHPEGEKLALLIGTAWQQLGDQSQATHFVKRALAWGCDKTLVARVLIAGVHNSLAKASALSGLEQRALTHFSQSVDGVGGDKRLACQARSVRETARLGLLGETSQWLVRAEEQPTTRNRSLRLPYAISGAETSDEEIQSLVDACLSVDDVHAALDWHADSLGRDDRFRFFCNVARRFRQGKDNLTALHFLSRARGLLTEKDRSSRAKLAKMYVEFGRAELGAELLLDNALAAADLSTSERKALEDAASGGSHKGNSSEHGHALLMEYLRWVLPDFVAMLGNARRPVLVEVGSTREDVPGQGSTRKLAEFCMEQGVHFITVDMDPHNTEMARKTFERLGAPFEAVSDKGEDFLSSYEGDLDFVFLDAYDFDHGKHSDVRQSRYRQFLGSEISDEDCHRMHLECAHAVADKLTPKGVVCIDDTWMNDDRWAAKGTLAVPYLIEKGFQVLSTDHKAALLRKPGA